MQRSTNMEFGWSSNLAVYPLRSLGTRRFFSELVLRNGVFLEEEGHAKQVRHSCSYIKKGIKESLNVEHEFRVRKIS